MISDSGRRNFAQTPCRKIGRRSFEAEEGANSAVEFSAATKSAVYPNYNILIYYVIKHNT